MKRLEDVLKRMSWGAIAVTAAAALVLAGCGDSGGGGEEGGTDTVQDAEGGGDTGEGGGDTGEGGGDTGEGGGDTGEGGGDTGGGDPEICDNGTDDDGDGQADCADSDCAAAANCGEDCVNGVDDNGNSLVDCFDPLCATSPACAEQNCDDGVDDDGDGLIDCGDNDCDDDPVCAPEMYPSCDDYYFCQIEEGCACTFGVDCPEDQTAEQQCASNCQQNPTCDQLCFSSMDPFFQDAWNDFLGCIQDNCAQLQGDAFVDCYIENCFEELAACYFTGPETECTYYYSCSANCASGAAGDECRGQCFDDLNKDAAIDLFDWDSCRFGYCDKDDDGFADSTECIITASFLACGSVEAAGTCADWGTPDGTGCGELVTCWTSCESLADGECLDACLVAASAEAFDTSGPTAGCLIQTCGTTADQLTTECMAAALQNECAAEFAQCNGGALVEICDNDADDDGDGDVDCDDADCEGNAACPSATSFDIRVIHLVPEAPGVDVFVNGVLSPITNLMFGEGTPYVPLAGGTYDFAVAPTGSPIGDAVLTVEDVALTNGMSYTVAAIPAEAGIQALLLSDNRAADVAEGTIHVRAVHAAFGVGAVDIFAITGADPIPLFQDLDFAAASDYLPVPAGEYTVGIDATGDGTAEFVFSLPAIPAGSVVTAYAVKDGDNVSLRAQFEDGTIVTITPDT